MTGQGALERQLMESIARAMEERGESGRTLAPKLDVSFAKLYRQLRGETPVTVSEYERLCQALGLDMVAEVRRARAALEPTPVAEHEPDVEAPEVDQQSAEAPAVGAPGRIVRSIR